MTNTPPPTRHWNPVDFGSCTCANLRMATRAVTRLFEEALAPAELTAPQFTLLAVLSKLGTLSVTQLAEATVTDRTTLTRNLKPLVERGLIAVQPGQDRRVRHFSLTKAGRRKVSQALPLWQGAQSHMIDGLGEADWRDLLARLGQATRLLKP